jgi:hypothetical protein
MGFGDPNPICPLCKLGHLVDHCDHARCGLLKCQRCGAYGEAKRRGADYDFGRWTTELFPGGLENPLT